MTNSPFSGKHTGPDAGWPETDLGQHEPLDLGATAVNLAFDEATDERSCYLRLAALAEIGQELNRRAGTPAGTTLPMSAQGCLAQYMEHRQRRVAAT